MNDQVNHTIGNKQAAYDSGPGPDMRHGPGPMLMSSTTLVGNDVCNEKGEKLGDIKDIMLDMSDAKVGYAVLSFSTFLGMGEKLFAVPWNALTLDTEHKRFVLNVEKERLKEAPGFPKDRWPNMADQTWAKEIRTYYETQPPTDIPLV
jgi:sporulation protein YlmC with PRC-barrel domain